MVSRQTEPSRPRARQAGKTERAIKRQARRRKQMQLPGGGPIDARTDTDNPLPDLTQPGQTRPGGGYIPGQHIPGDHYPDSGPILDDMLGGAFKQLDSELPLLLLPVRLETKFVLDADPPELRIRIYPDQVHINSDRPQPSKGETRLAKAFWTQWHSARDEAKRKAVWQQFTGQVGAKRAGHLARALRPTAGKNGKLVFPQPPVDASKPAPARPELLPERWLAIGYGIGEQIFQKASRPVARNLRTGPDAEAPSIDAAGGDLSVDEGLAWMVDYEQAVQAGMAITIPLTGKAAQATDRVQVLLVVGLVEDVDPTEASDALARLLEAHARTSGLAFVPQGTPTNNTEAVSAGWTYEELEAAEMGERSFKDLPKAPPSVFDDNAAQLAGALGFNDANFLRRLPHGTDREGTQSRQMRTVLFEAVLGTLLRQLLDVGTENGISPAAVSAARSWFIDHLTGGAPVPLLRIGAQPYGILPVRRAVSDPDPATTAGQVERMVDQLIDVWRASLVNLPSLEGEPDDPDDEVEAAIATILATQPHPARLFVRHMDEYIAGETPMTSQAVFKSLVDLIGSDESPQEIRDIALVLYGVQAHNYPFGVKTIDEQLDVWTKVQDELDKQNNTEGSDYVEYILNILRAYEGRQRPLRWLGLDGFEGVMGQENTKLVAAALWYGSGEWGSAGLVQALQPGPGHTAAEYLADLKRRSQNGSTEPSDWSPKPLLYQLIELTLPLVPKLPPAKTKFVDALEGLSALDPERLEWLLRETLGLGSHRLDAWATSLASERLERMREARPAGLQIGAFGWIFGLEPRRQKRTSSGFIHAPSLAHATTAALLRAGWDAHEDGGSSGDSGGGALSPLAVNLSSEQVRKAEWLLDGVRQGQPLGDLLGYHFERSLHDRAADEYIRAVRQMVLTAQGRPNASLDQPVDGIELLDLHRENKLSGDPLPQKVQDALADLESAFDAVYDAGLFEAVHQLASGSFERAAAMMDSIALGTIDPPELRSPLTPRSAVSVEHRVMILLRPDAEALGRGWTSGMRDRLATALESWAASLLPAAGEVGFQVTEILPDGQAGLSGQMTLLKLNLSALDAVYLAGDDPHAAPAPLRTLAAGAAKTANPVQIDPAVSDAPFSLADFTVLAGELRRLIETLRPLDARDLRPAAEQGEPDSDLSTARDAAAGLINEFEQLGSRFLNTGSNGGQQDTAGAVTYFARLGISSGGSPYAGDDLQELMLMVQRRLAKVAVPAEDETSGLNGGPVGRDPISRGPIGRGPVDDGPDKGGAGNGDVKDGGAANGGGGAGTPDHSLTLEARLAALFGRRVPLMGRFTLAGAPNKEEDGDSGVTDSGVTGAVVDVTHGPAPAHAVDDWLDAAGRVRADVGRLTTAGMLSELMGAGGLAVQAGQTPLEPGEGWAATSQPAGTGRLSITAVSGPGGPPAVGELACGLLVDQWSDAIPADEQVTGVTFQFNAPTNRPPQSWLLAVPPDGEGWSLKLVTDTLMQTLEWAMLRAVGPEHLVDYGRAVPTTVVPGNIVYWREENAE